MRELKGNIFLGKKGFVPGKVYIDNGIINTIIIDTDGDGNVDIDDTDNKILPGLIDIHTHGANGYDFCDASADAIRAIDEYENRNGIVRFCGATMTLGEEMLTKICKAAKEAVSDCKSFCGIYLEGPFLSPNRIGAQNGQYLKVPDYSLVERLNEESENLIKYVVVAPELDGAIDMIHSLNRKGIRCSIGHSNADYDTAKEAAAKGAKHITHLYNAMPMLNHRQPGIIGMALDEDGIEVELIADAIHVHPSVVRMTFDAKRPEDIMLISDSTMATGYEDGIYHLGDKEIIVKDKCCRLADGTIAGGARNLYECMVKAIEMGVDYIKAIEAASINPARSLGIDDMYGSIETGKSGRLIIADRDYNIIEVLS